jgi:hypothetical protein
MARREEKVMDSDIVEAVTEWESREVTGGHARLADLADGSFTGAVTAGTAWLFMLNGRVVGVFDGSMADFDGGAVTAYEAPDPSLPLLFAMRETGGESRAKYYTEDTPLSEVDDTLSAGNFTGYVELSENVLSGDYYLVYHGGRSLACAFVGNSRRVLTGEEAFERAADEVGIYQVYEVDLEVTEVPEADGSETTGADDIDAVGAATTAAAAGSETEATPDPGPAADAENESAPSTMDHGDADPEGTVEPTRVDAGGSSDTTDGTDRTDSGDAEAEPTGTGAEAIPDEPGTTDSGDAEASDPVAGDDETATAPPRSSAQREDTAASAATEVGAEESDPDPRAASAPGGVADTDSVRTPADQDVFSEEAEWREATAIPSLDPSNSELPEGHPGAPDDDVDAAPEGTDGRSPRKTPRRPDRTASPTAAEETDADDEEGSETEPDPQVAELRERLHEARQAREEAETDRERLSARADDLESERDRYRERVQELESDVEALQAEVDRLEGALAEAEAGPGGPGGRTMAPDAALEGTNLFVRYDSKGGATLEKAHAGDVDREAFVENLRLEHHTSFDTEDLTVADQPYGAFLRSTIEYGFVRWVVEDLLYEIRETGHTGDLDRLFDALPKVDRAELYGTVSVVYTEDGEENREQQTFDVVLRDRMGNPLVVANLNDSRDPATGDEMTSLVGTARRVKETSDSLGAAFFVTASYFEPGALETAADATGGGLLGREKRASFVKLSRKSGFHLCLVETREGNFHVNVPEL